MAISLRILTIACVALAWVTPSPTFAQAPKQQDPVAGRIQELEAQTQLLQEQVRALKTRQLRLERLPAVNADPAAGGVTMNQVRGEIKKFAWKKGGYTITPYGILWGSATWESQRSFPGSYILWMESFSDENEDACYIDARSTRLGLDIAGPKFCCCPQTKVSGKVEFDFQSGAAPRPNQGSVLFRHGYVKADNGHSMILFGQTWDVMSPLNPTMLGYIPAWGSGNIGYRRPQLRYDRNFALSDRLLLKSQKLDQPRLQLGLQRSTAHRRTDGRLAHPGNARRPDAGTAKRSLCPAERDRLLGAYRRRNLRLRGNRGTPPNRQPRAANLVGKRRHHLPDHRASEGESRVLHRRKPLRVSWRNSSGNQSYNTEQHPLHRWLG